MSMEIYVLSDRMPKSIPEWQAVIDARAMPLRLSTDVAFDKLTGALPVILNGKSVAFECDHWAVSDVVDGYSEVDVGGPWRYALAFRWGADLSAAMAAYRAASAYAVASGGVILDGEEGKVISADRAADIADEIEQQAPLIDEAIQRMLASFKK